MGRQERFCGSWIPALGTQVQQTTKFVMPGIHAKPKPQWCRTCTNCPAHTLLLFEKPSHATDIPARRGVDDRDKPGHDGMSEPYVSAYGDKPGRDGFGLHR